MHSTSSRETVFMDDNGRSHGTRAVKEYLETEGINYLVQPSVTPDMNPLALGTYLIKLQYDSLALNKFDFFFKR